MKYFIFVASLFLLLSLIYFLFIQKPSHNREWESGFEDLPIVSINGDLIEIKNIRDWGYSKEGPTSFDYKDAVYNLKDLKQTWFLVEPFGEFDSIAHTYFVFDFSNNSSKETDFIAFSVEARREKGEEYSGFLGLFNKYELIYSWGTEKDFTGRRVYLQENDVYMYPLQLNKEQQKNLFKKLALETQELEENPKFYNTITANCTNLLAKYSREINKKSLPFYSLFLPPGHSDNLLYRLGYIPNMDSFENMRNKYFITPYAKEVYKKDNFSQSLRSHLQ